jgi:hypothetical protein
MTRLTTKGDPEKALESIGLANNMLARERAKMGDGAQTRVVRNGIELRLNANGIDQVIIDAPVKQEQKIEAVDAPQGSVVVYSYEGAKHGAISALSRKSIIQKTKHFFGTEPAMEIGGTISARTIIIAEPVRRLVEHELRIIKKRLDAQKVNVFIYPGTDAVSFNAILGQLGSNMRVIRMESTYGAKQKTSLITADTSALYRQPTINRGFLHPVAEHKLTATVKDMFCQLVATPDVIVLAPAFYYSSAEAGDYVYRAATWTDAPTEEELQAQWSYYRSALLSLSDYPHDWNDRTLTEYFGWASNLAPGAIRKRHNATAAALDQWGYHTYADRGQYDVVSAACACERGTSLYVHSFSPEWLREDYLLAATPQDDVDQMCKWMGRVKEANRSQFNHYMAVAPYQVINDYDEWVPPIQA